MGALQSKKCDYESISSKSGRYINEDNEVSKRQSDFKRKYKPASASPAGAAAAAYILSRYSGSPLKKRLKSDTITGEDKNTTQEFSDMKTTQKNKNNITGTSLELGTIEGHRKEVHIANIKESTKNKSYHHLVHKICLRGGPYFRKFLPKPIVAAKPLLILTKTENTVVKTNCETDLSTIANTKGHDDILAQIKLDKLKSQILSRVPMEQVIIMEKLMAELKQRLAQRCKEIEKSATSQQHQPKKDTKNYNLKIRHSYSRSRYTPYESLKQKRKEYLGTSVLATQQYGSFPELRRILKPRFLPDIPEEQVKLMEKVMTELKEHIAKRNLKKEMQTLCQTKKSTCLNEKYRNEVRSQAQHQHDLAVISSRSSVFFEISRNRTTEIKSQAKDLDMINPRTSLTKEMQRRISNPNLRKEMKSEELTNELKLRIAKCKLLKGISRKRDIGIKFQAQDLAVISPSSSLAEKLMKEMELRIAKRALEKEMKAASIKPRKKYSQVSLPPTASEGENIDKKVRRSLKPLFLCQIPIEQATLIANVMSELEGCLAKRSVEHKDKILYSIPPKLINRTQAATGCLQPTKLRMQARNVYGRSPIC